MRSKAVGLALVLTASISSAQQRSGTYREQARVERVVVDAYVLDPRGDPIPDLAAHDFRLRVDGRPVAIESAEWIPADRPEALPSLVRSPSGALLPTAPEMPPGRLLIFFFQTDQFVGERLLGLMRMALQARQMLDTL